MLDLGRRRRSPTCHADSAKPGTFTPTTRNAPPTITLDGGDVDHPQGQAGEEEVTDDFSGDSRSNRERMLAGDWYIADDPNSGRLSIRATHVADAYHRASVEDPAGAVPLLAELLGGLGEHAFVKPPLAPIFTQRIGP